MKQTDHNTGITTLLFYEYDVLLETLRNALSETDRPQHWDRNSTLFDNLIIVLSVSASTKNSFSSYIVHQMLDYQKYSCVGRTNFFTVVYCMSFRNKPKRTKRTW